MTFNLFINEYLYSFKEKQEAENAIKNENKENERNKSNEHLNESRQHNESQSINCVELGKLMDTKADGLLLIDCRSSKEYNESRIDFKNIINIPNETINKG